MLGGMRLPRYGLGHACNNKSMPEKLSTRMDRAERLIEALADKQTKLDDVLVTLAESQIKLQESQIKTEERFRQLEERFRQTDERFRETDKRFRETDERIEKLVSAIGAMI